MTSSSVAHSSQEGDTRYQEGVALGNLLIDFRKDLKKLIDGMNPFLLNRDSMAGKLLIVDRQQGVLFVLDRLISLA